MTRGAQTLRHNLSSDVRQEAGGAGHSLSNRDLTLTHLAMGQPRELLPSFPV